jgi:predicted nucleotidyltransferase
MQKFEILLNRSFSATTTEKFRGEQFALDEVAPVEKPLFKSQQEPTFQQEYFLYLQKNGVSLVNNLNVKAYLNNPKNETITKEFVNYLSGTTPQQEFLDILYDDNKLSEYFNDYYRKFYTYTNEGLNENAFDPSIDLQSTKDRILQQDRLYAKTNSLTNYYLNEFDSAGRLSSNSRRISISQDEEKYFSGKNESYYVNIVIERGVKSFFSDDFSEYYMDKCDGTVAYNKYAYISEYLTQTSFGNFSWLESKQTEFNLATGPTTSSIEKLKNLLPVNFLNRDNQESSSENIGATGVINAADQTQNLIFQNSFGYVALPLPTGSGNPEILNFKNFSDFQNYTGFYFYSWAPDLASLGINPADQQKYIYQQVVSYVDMWNQQLYGVWLATQGRDSAPPAPPLYSSKFEKIPDPYNERFLGQEFDRLNTNRIRLRVLNTRGVAENVKVRWEPCSVGTLGPNDGFNYVSFDINGNTDPTVSAIDLYFQANDSFLDVFINVYNNWQVRSPLVFSLRPLDKPNLILEYLVVYLEEFFPLQNFSFSERIDVTSYDVCNLMYNSFVYRNFNDNFFETQRPDGYELNFVNSTGITIQQSSNLILMSMIPTVNSRLLSLFNNNQIDIYSIAGAAGVPVTGIYNIYVWGSYLFGTSDEYSDIDLIVVADGNIPVRQTKLEGIDVAVYTPQRFQAELEEVVVQMFGQTNSSDRVFTVYNSANPDFKILERITFYAENSKAEIKRKAEIFKNERLIAVEQAFFDGNLDAWQKRLWSIFRNLEFSIQVVRDGRINDIYAANGYLEDIKSKNFNSYVTLIQYFNPKIQNLYSALLSL